MKVPTVHINGTSRDVLAVSLEVAVSSLREAIVAVQGCEPNGRDYYVQGPDAIRAATHEHADRLRKLEEVRNELTAMWEAICQ